MRVLEAKPVATQTMGKKKHKLHKKSQDNEPGGSDSSDELVMVLPSASGGSCPHIAKAVNPNATRKTLRQHGRVGECTSCERQKCKGVEKSELTEVCEAEASSTGESSLEGPEITVWVCLQCGHQGCDRNSREKHALKHYGTPRSTSHALVVNTTTWNVWCYACDEDISGSSSRKLFDCVDFVKKLAGAPRPESQLASSLKQTGSGRKENPGVNQAAAENISTGQEEKSKGGKQCNTPPGQVGLPLGLPKVKGLNNLGNTCFFNAVLQNLSQTPGLEGMISEWGKKGVRVTLPGCLQGQFSEEDSDVDSSADEEEPQTHMELEPLNFELGEAGVLTQSVLTFLRDMNAPTKNTTLSPSGLFGQICRKAPRFKGFQQQDSHELLRYLMDGMKADEIKRFQVGILRAFQLPDNVNPKKVDEDTRGKIKGYGRQVKYTFVDKIFGGYFISTVLCEDCKTPSQIFEPFLDISLPITEEKPSRPNVWGLRKKDVKLPEAASTPALPQYPVQHDRPKKRLSKKAKKQARREAKRKTHLSKSKASADHQEQVEEDSSIEQNGPEVSSEIGDKHPTCDGSSHPGSSMYGSKDSISVEYSDSKSDAEDSDIEDNAESDVSRHRISTVNRELHHVSPLAICKTECCEKNSEKCCNVLHENEKLTECSAPLANCEVRGLTNNVSSQMSALTVNCDKESGVVNRENHDECPCTSPTADCQDSLTAQLETLDIAGENGYQIRDDEKPVQASDNSAERPEKEKRRADLKLEAQLMAMNSLVPRLHTAQQECSILSCLNQFTTAELLTGNNRFGCEYCTKVKNGRKSQCSDLIYSNASKQVLIFQPPAILTLHLKRFQQVGFTLRKVNRHVQFPLELDAAPYCSSLAQGLSYGQKQVMYALYGVVEHSGRLSGGHYTAYVKVRPNSDQFKDFLQANDINGLKLHRLVELIKAKASVITEEQEDCVKPVAPPGKWYYISDSRVSEVSEAVVLRCQAYLLFYERIC